MASELDIILRAKDEASAILQKVQGEMDAVGNRADGMGGKLASVGPLAMAGFAAAGAAVVGLGVAAYKLGSDFQDAYKTIRIGTGAVGDNLEGLKETFKNVVKDVPTDFKAASTAIADLNTRTGLTGPALEDLAKTMLNFSRITGTDVAGNIASATRAFGDWGIATNDQVETMDKFFRASQSTGIGVDALMGKVVQFGAPLRQLGFDFDTSIALLSKFEKEGVNAELVLGSMRIALGKFAKEGQPAEEALRNVIAAIEGAGDASEANKLALEVFGARAGPDMAAAIREGRLSVDDLVETIRTGGDSINKLASDTETASDKWTKAMNTFSVAVEPAATAVFELAGTVLEDLMPAIQQAAKDIAPIAMWLADKLPGAFAIAKAAIGPFVSVFLNSMRAILDSVVWVGDKLFGLLDWIGGLAGRLGIQLPDWKAGWEEFKNIPVASAETAQKQVSASVQTMAKDAGEAARKAVDDVEAAFNTFPQKITTPMSHTADQITATLQGIRKDAPPEVQAMVDDMLTDVERFRVIAPSKVDAARGDVISFLQSMKTGGDSVMEAWVTDNLAKFDRMRGGGAAAMGGLGDDVAQSIGQAKLDFLDTLEDMETEGPAKLWNLTGAGTAASEALRLGLVDDARTAKLLALDELEGLDRSGSTTLWDLTREGTAASEALRTGVVDDTSTTRLLALNELGELHRRGSTALWNLSGEGTDAASKLQTDVTTSLKTTKTDGTTAMESLQVDGTRAMTKFSQDAQSVMQAISHIAVEVLGKTMSTVASAVVRAAEAMADAFEDAEKRFGESMSQMAKSAITGSNAITNALNSIPTSITTVHTIITNAVGGGGGGGGGDSMYQEWVNAGGSGDPGDYQRHLQNLRDAIIAAGGVPNFARGVQNFAGGIALVGERGPELVKLPPGSDVIPGVSQGGLAQPPYASQGGAVSPVLGAGLLAEMQRVFDILTDGARRLGDTVITSLRRPYNTILEGAEKLAEGVLTSLRRPYDVILDGAQKLADGVLKSLDRPYHVILDGAAKLARGVLAEMTPLYRSLIQGAAGLRDGMLAPLSGLYTTLTTGAEAMAGSIIATFGMMAAHIVRAMVWLYDRLVGRSIVPDLVASLIEQFTRLRDGVLSRAEVLARWTPEPVGMLNPINSDPYLWERAARSGATDALSGEKWAALQELMQAVAGVGSGARPPRLPGAEVGEDIAGPSPPSQGGLVTGLPSQGGLVTGLPSPGVGAGPRPPRLPGAQIGEDIAGPPPPSLALDRFSGGGPINVIIQVGGDIVVERDFVKRIVPEIRRELITLTRRNPTTGLV